MITAFFTPKEIKNKAAVGTKRQTSPEGKDGKQNKRTKVENQNFPKDFDSLSDPVKELMEHLRDESWRKALLPYVSKPSFQALSKFVASQRASKTVYPPPQDTFSALNFVPFHKVKVVVVGQDPYHQPNQGHGLAFSVRKGVMIPPSLRNIYKELVDDDTTMMAKPTHGYLEKWAQQGVLMLNSVLTVRRGEANSHAKRGWEEFTDEIIRLLVLDRRDKNKSKKENEKDIGLVFLLWGRPANKKAESVIGKYRVASKSTVICTSHPSPLGASKTKSPFLGSGCFSKANCALVEMGLDPVDWRVEE